MSGNCQTIDEVIHQLDEAVEWCVQNNCRAGIFAALYRQVTINVKNRIIKEDYFDDNDRMARLDVNFANRYLQAFNQYKLKQSMTKSWEVSFKGVESNSLIILQHLLLGINAHINLDLGIACALTSPGDSLTSLKNDFYKINKLLFDLLNDVQERINLMSPWLKIIDLIGKNDDEKIMNFSIQRARDFAWQLAEQLAIANKKDHDFFINIRDDQTALLASIITNPGWFLRFALGAIKLREEKDCRTIIKALNLR